MKSILAALFLLLVPALAISQPVTSAPTLEVPTLGTAVQPGTAPVTQNTVTTTGPVTSETKISVGTIAGEAVMWVASVFGTTIGAALTALIWRLLKNAGIAGNDLLRQRLQGMIVNGLNAGAREVSDSLKDKGQIEIKNDVVAKAVVYVQEHGKDTLKQLGIDPTSNEAVEAIKARIETAINDPATPTPPAVEPQKVIS